LSGLGGFRVGIQWQGNCDYMFDRARSVPLVEFAPLADVAGVSLVSLQRKNGTEQLPSARGQFTIHDLGEDVDESRGPFVDTAAVMKNLDLVITSDTAAAHLAGGLGISVWVALPHAADWRWLLDRADCPWYPTMRLFRQRQWHEWSSVFAEIGDALKHAVLRARRGTCEHAR
ncbi:MAG TPA: hypothetical protein VHV08_01225, partial [Pirellulales bacterium]|nr:hypothetical protein [Pirellulales bacterium]